MTPEFAIIGHPNEGKSSVLSTLAEDDSVVVSSTPGETKRCRTFPIIIDSKEILRFTDTPGFQNPRKLLAAIKKSKLSGIQALREFVDSSKNDNELSDDCELLSPIIDGAAIIYVVDGSRPLRTIDKIEMEILRLTGQPRMSIINNKDDQTEFLDDWKNEFRKNFNVTRQFNAHRATYGERINLLEALKAIDQDLEPTINKIITTFKRDWDNRNSQVVNLIGELLQKSLNHIETSPISDTLDTELQQQTLYKDYCNSLSKLETSCHNHIRSLFKHNVFDYNLPENSILQNDLFSTQTWQLLGLSKKQVAIAGGLGGAGIGATIDIATAGISFGIFTTIGTMLGTVGAMFGGKKASQNKGLIGSQMGGELLQIGPNTSTDFPFILLDRALLFYSHIINWAHGRRDYSSKEDSYHLVPSAESITAKWSTKNLKICSDYFKAISKNSSTLDKHQDKFGLLLTQILMEQSTKETI